MAYADRLEDFPDLPLFCSNPECKEDWRSFKGVKARNGGQMGIPQGIVDHKNKVVVLREERHWRCDNCRCKPPNGATVTINGVQYRVTSMQDRQLRKLP